MTTRRAYMNGAFVPETEARISLWDSALATGDFVLEVIRTFDHRPFHVAEHLERLSGGLREFRIVPDLTMEGLERIVYDTLEANYDTEERDVDWQVMIYVSRGLESTFGLFSQAEQRPTVVVGCFPLVARLAALATKYRTGLDLMVPPQRAVPAHLLPPHIKSRGRLDLKLARIQAAEIAPGSSAILVDPDDFVMEGTGTNLFVGFGHRLYTPPFEDVVPGVTRAAVIELARASHIDLVEERLRRAALSDADEMFVTSTVIGIQHVRSFEGRRLGDGGCGPLTARVRAAFNRDVGIDIVAQAEAYASRLRDVTTQGVAAGLV
jgi:branched-chain amino acid aminotransferase